ncbi:bifunctional phosphopantothenoylcysteine decarboxylase/phosphopantothenate--cysteine ligase CoaBC [Atopobiaceae bacterium 24-176]
MNVVLGVTGCIAAYKAAEVCRGLQKAGCKVRVTMTEAATRFVGAATFEGLTSTPVASDLFAWPLSAIPHIELGEWADVFLVCPCTADVMAKIACGIADDCLTSAALATTAPLLVAPAMNVHMWHNPATQANLSALRDRGVSVIMPASGRLACGDVGEGKLASVDKIVSAALAFQERPLAGTRVLVTAGPTHEAIDPVRYIANASSGKMGYAVAAEAARRGAEVCLVSGPCSLPAPAGVERVDVVSAADMHAAVMERAGWADVAVCAAAVADYTPAAPADHKLKKAEGRLDSVELVETADILADLAASGQVGYVAGFAAETRDLLANAKAKLKSKGADLLVANDVSRPDSAFGSDTDHVWLLDATGAQEFATASKTDVARAIWDRIQGARPTTKEKGK